MCQVNGPSAESEVVLQGPTETIWDALQRHHRLVNDLLRDKRAAEQENALLKSEAAENARIIGMSGSREAVLLARLRAAETERAHERRRANVATGYLEVEKQLNLEIIEKGRATQIAASGMSNSDFIEWALGRLEGK